MKYFVNWIPLNTHVRFNKPTLKVKYKLVDGWRPREHVAFLFSEDNEEFHNLTRKHIVMPFITGDFFPGHGEEVAGGKYFALVKPNAGGAPIPNARGAPLLTPMCGE